MKLKAKMQLSVYSLKRIIFEGEARSVNCMTAAGEITVLDHHRPLISLLQAGTVEIKDAKNKEYYFEVEKGFIEVDASNSVKLLVDERVVA